MSIMFIKNIYNRIFIAFLVIVAAIWGSLYLFGVYRAQAEENSCQSLGLSILPAYINIEDFKPGTAQIRQIRLRRSCVSEDYGVGIEAGDGDIAPWLSFEPRGIFEFKTGAEDAYVDTLISVPFNTEAGIYKGALTFKLLPRHTSRSGVTININIGVRAIIKINVTERDEAIFESSEAIAVRSGNMFNRLRGRILINVDEMGRAYYINPLRPVMYYLGRPGDAMRIMREQGEGITNIDLEKISESVADEDDVIVIDLTPVKVFAKHNAGRIFLETEKNGEAWYVDPGSYKRYYLGHPDDAFLIMRELGLGISGEDFMYLVTDQG